MRTYLGFSIVILLIISACSHTNNLHKYELTNKRFYFESLVSPDAGRVDIIYSSEKPSPKKEDDKSKFGEVILDLAQIIGTSILTAEVENKLVKAANPEEISARVSEGIKETILKHIDIVPVNKVDANTDFLVTTVLDECRILSTQYNVSLHLKVTSSISERNTGNLVWENSESLSVPLRRRIIPDVEHSTGKRITDVAQAAELATLSEEEIRDAINRASIEIGRLFADTFRKDLAKAAKKAQKG